MMKLKYQFSKDAKYTHWELGTVLLFNIEALILKFPFGPEKFPSFNFENRAPELNNHKSPTDSGL